MFELFHAAIKEGMTDFTIYRVPEGWQVSSRWRSGSGWRVNTTKDIEVAIRGALSTKKYIEEEEDDGEDLV